MTVNVTVKRDELREIETYGDPNDEPAEWVIWTTSSDGGSCYRFQRTAQMCDVFFRSNPRYRFWVPDTVFPVVMYLVVTRYEVLYKIFHENSSCLAIGTHVSN